MADRAAGAKPAGASRFRYFGETISELKKVVWLTRQETMYLTALVIIVSIVVGVILGGLDYGFAGLIDKVILGR